MTPKTKKCGSCRRYKPRDKFSRAAKAKDGLQHYCKACASKRERARKAERPETPRVRRDRYLRLTHGLTIEQHEAMLAAQHGRCACCHDPLGEGHNQVVDHSHVTGRFRGIICRGCNLAIGHARDDVRRLQCMIAYLNQHG